MKSNPHGLPRGGEQDMEQDHTPRKRVPEGENPAAKRGSTSTLIRKTDGSGDLLHDAGVSARAPDIPAAREGATSVHPRLVHETPYARNTHSIGKAVILHLKRHRNLKST